jgi:hypothetical protein
MDIARAGQFLLLMLLPTLLVAAVLHLPRGIALVGRVVMGRDGSGPLQAAHPPIEQLAADLRRLVRRHEELMRSTDVAMRGRRLQALEAAIADCALDAARALELPRPDRPVHGTLAKPELGRLLHALREAGLVLPPAVSLSPWDGRQ